MKTSSFFNKLCGFVVASLLCGGVAKAEDVKTVKLAGPFLMQSPLVIDSVDATQKNFDSFNFIDTPLLLSRATEGHIVDLSADSVSTMAEEPNKKMMLAAFSFSTSAYTKVAVKVKGPKNYKVFINEKPHSQKEPFQMGQYDVVVKFLADTASLKLSLEAEREGAVTLVSLTEGVETKRPFDMGDVMEMKHYYGESLSPSGKYAIYASYWTDSKGTGQRIDRVVETATGRIISTRGGMNWMPRSDKLLTTRKIDGKNMLISINPADMSETILCEQLPETSYTMSPTEDFLILYKLTEGPKRENGVYEILNPDDRQGGWRNRYQLQKYDLKSGLSQILTFGNKSIYLNDISPDGKSIIFSIKEDRFTKRPTSLSTYCLLDLETMKCDTLIRREGFVNSVKFIPSTNKLIVTGTPEAFGRRGCVLPDDVVPSMYDYQLFLFNLADKSVETVTRDFDPSVANVRVTGNNGTVYFTANNADSVSLYRLDANTGKIKMIPLPCENVMNFSVAWQGNRLMYSGCGACEADKLYVLDTKSLKSVLADDANADRMSEIDLGSCRPFRMKSSRGDILTGHYYLPAHFDETKKYPVIVHYYGGCTPTSRRFGGGGHYPAHYWNALGYVVLICNPSGASGFGQEWASRHVNTMGEGVAEDIIEMTRHFIDTNRWVDGEKVGCVSASYGGFMTQLLLTKTDLFAAGISHAGISDHSSYWGEGYWGYSYSEVSAANSYPWTRKDLFVDRSPLYNADKIKKPLLFTHGTADTNVPIGESIQMYTALKLLGVPTAFVMVEGENHGIMDFHKRQKWINTMVAWFDKYLKGDSAWWDALYVPKEL